MCIGTYIYLHRTTRRSRVGPEFQNVTAMTAVNPLRFTWFDELAKHRCSCLGGRYLAFRIHDKIIPFFLKKSMKNQKLIVITKTLNPRRECGDNERGVLPGREAAPRAG